MSDTVLSGSRSDPPFQPKPSLQAVANYLVAECTRKFPLEQCAVCSKPALPEDPKVCYHDNNDIVMMLHTGTIALTYFVSTGYGY